MAAGGRQSADALIRRVAQGGARNVTTRIVPGDSDFFEIAPHGKQVLITANSAVNAATGFNWYLKYVAGIHLSWNHLSQRLPDNMPLPERTIRQETDMALRYYLNFCTFSYSTPFWDWERWQQEIDWMAMHGINMPLDIIGNEVVWRNILAKVGYNDADIDEFITGPAFMAWWQMNNLEGWGGPNPEWWYTRQEALQKQILKHMSELGMTPVLPGFSGMMPRTAHQKLGINTVDAGRWNGFYRPSFLNPGDPEFDKLADLYYKESERLYGKARYYAMDPFHEGAKAEGVDIAQAGRKILAAMKRANPAATWVLQGWQHNPLPEMTRALPRGSIVILDLQSEKRPKWGDPRSVWAGKTGFDGHDWVFCMLQNFGGRTGLGGAMDDMVNGYYDARRLRGHGMVAEGMSGVGATPEAIEQNPVMFELLFELPWRGERFDPAEWLDGYIAARYGGMASPEIAQAWELLHTTSYNIPRDLQADGTIESVICARPGLHLKRASTWGSAELYYDPEFTERAADLMWSARTPFGDVEADLFDTHTLGAMTPQGSATDAVRRAAAVNNFAYDFIDIKRQALADRANRLSEQFSAAHDKGDMREFGRLGKEFISTIDEMNELLAARPEFRLDTWINAARAVAPAGKPKVTTKDEWASYADWMEWNARTLVTVWGPREAADRGGLHDYSSRQWHGLLDLYARRWLRFFEAELAERGSGARIDWFEMEQSWVSVGKTTPAP